MISFLKFISHALFDFISKSKNAVAKQPKRRGVHFAEVDLNEEADSLSDDSERSDDEDAEMGEGDSDEFIDVLAVLMERVRRTMGVIPEGQRNRMLREDAHHRWMTRILVKTKKTISTKTTKAKSRTVMNQKTMLSSSPLQMTMKTLLLKL
jgi:hypothetical protein